MARKRIDLCQDDVDLPGIGMLGWYDYAASQEGLSTHEHGPYLEICHLARGSQVYATGGRCYQLNGGDCYIVHPHRRHDSHGEPQQKGELYWILLQPDHPHLLDLPSDQAAAIGRALLDLPHTCFPGPADGPELLAPLYRDPRPFSPLQRCRRTTLLCRYLLALIDAGRADSSNRADPDLEQCCELVEQHIGEPLPVSRLAAWSGLSPGRFKVRFRRTMGMPPADYVLRRKLAHARERLRAGRPVLDVALDLGFSTSQYFATVFRRYHGTSPTGWLAADRSARQPSD